MVQQRGTRMTKYRSKIRQDIPQSGWTLQECFDNETANHRCEACGFPKVRFVHRISHANVGTPLLSGCECASQLTGNPELSRWREYELKKEAIRRSKFVRQGWSLFDNGATEWKHVVDRAYWLNRADDGMWSLSWSQRNRPTIVLSVGHRTRDAAATALYKTLGGPA